MIRKGGYKMNLPNDPIMLMSILNTKLRDRYSSLDELCADMELNREETEKKLAAVGFVYKESINQFR